MAAVHAPAAPGRAREQQAAEGARRLLAGRQDRVGAGGGLQSVVSGGQEQRAGRRSERLGGGRGGGLARGQLGGARSGCAAWCVDRCPARGLRGTGGDSVGI